MKTQYKIIWVDDDMSSVETDQDDLIDFLEQYGIEVIYSKFEASEEQNIHEQIKSDIDDPELDLLIIDYQMAGIDGKELIAMIRGSDHVFLPVIFYSNIGPEALMEKALEAHLEGVYFAGRDRLQNKIQQVITSLLNKEQTVKRTRGLLMEGVSEIDSNIGNFVRVLWSKLEDVQQEELISYFKEKLKEDVERTEEKLSNLPEDRDGFIADLEKNLLSSKYTTMQRWKLFKKMLELASIDNTLTSIFTELHQRTGNDPSLLKIRNDYAHHTRSVLDSNHTPPKCIYIRKELRRHYKNMSDIEETIS